MEGVCTSLREVRAKSITADIFHFVFVGQRGDGALWVFAGKLFVEEDEVCESAADFADRFGKALEVGLGERCQL